MSLRTNLDKDSLFCPEPFHCVPLLAFLCIYLPINPCYASESGSLSSKSWIFWEEWMGYRAPGQIHWSLIFPVSYLDWNPSAKKFRIASVFPLFCISKFVPRQVSGKSQRIRGNIATPGYPAVTKGPAERKKRAGEEKMRMGDRYCTLPPVGNFRNDGVVR